MATEVENTRKAARGAQAQALLESDIFKEAIKSLHDDYISAWKIASVKDVDGKERLWQAVNILGKITDHIAKVIVDGRIASKDLAAIKTLKR